MRWGALFLAAGICGCGAPPGQPSDAGGSSTVGTSGTAVGTTMQSSTSGSPPSTFGMGDDPDDGSEVGFVGPLDVSCASASSGVSAHCALCSVRDQNCFDDFKCVAWAEDDGDAWTGTKCIGTALAPIEVGEACTVDGTPVSGRDDCVRGSMCWDVDPGSLEGVCVPFCGSEDTAGQVCPDGTACMDDGQEVLALCLPPCDPLAPLACAADEICRWFPASAAGFCIPQGGGVVELPTIQCGSEFEACPASSVCVSAATFGGCGAPTCCTPWCDLTQPGVDAECAAREPGQVCVPVIDRRPVPEPYAHLGVCAVPPRERR
ncbi:MAG: hypothetical protein K0V04_20425 [Deltaproteobacteria bacterium]|nr:hypothetical protein [Deltaproteobacteria bacterium]